MIEMKDEKPTDHRPFFILGCSLITVGISLISAVGPAFLGFLGAGVVFMAIGLADKDKGESKRETV
jgi:hypothetical protein